MTSSSSKLHHQSLHVFLWGYSKGFYQINPCTMVGRNRISNQINPCTIVGRNRICKSSQKNCTRRVLQPTNYLAYPFLQVRSFFCFIYLHPSPTSNTICRAILSVIHKIHRNHNPSSPIGSVSSFASSIYRARDTGVAATLRSNQTHSRVIATRHPCPICFQQCSGHFRQLFEGFFKPLTRLIIYFE